MHNTPKPQGNATSRFKGVHLTKHGTWRAEIRVSCKPIRLGTFKSETEAAHAYDYAAYYYYGEFAWTNFDRE